MYCTVYISGQIYNLTIDSFLGASYCVAAGFEGVQMVGMLFVWVYISRYL